MTTRIAINGVGRIGRALLRAASLREDLEVVALNDPTPLEQTAHLLRHDSTLGPFPEAVAVAEAGLAVGERILLYSQETDPAAIDWVDAEPRAVIEASGRFADRAQAAVHVNGSVRRVVISANSVDADALVCFGINHLDLDGSETVISASSCTTNCVAAVIKPILRHLGVRRLMLMTVHCYNANQSLVDAAQPDLRRARAAGLNLIPTTTGASWAVERVLPELANRVSGYAVRVPAAQVSMVDLVIETERSGADGVALEILRTSAEDELKGVLAVSDEPLVSSDFAGSPYSAVVDAGFVDADDRRLRLLAWYDNETGYANRLADLVHFLAVQRP